METGLKNSNAVAQYIFDFDLANAPDIVVQRAKLCVMDTIGVMLGGLNTNASRIVREVLAVRGGEKEARIFGSRIDAPAAEAAFANCFAANILDMDDGHDLGGHPGAPIVPSALAISESIGVSGKEFLEAVIVGYEISIRALDILTAGFSGSQNSQLPSTGEKYHCTGTGGAYGVAAVACKLYKLPPSQIIQSLGLTGAYAPTTRPRQGYWLGAMEKESIGMAAKIAIESTQLAKHGMTGPHTIFDDDHGRPTSFNSLGKEYEILNTYFKPYPSCRYTHSAIEITSNLMNTHKLKSNEILKIKVSAPLRHIALNSQAPSSIVQAQFSIPFVVGAVISYGRHSIKTMTDESLSNKKILEQAAKVTIEHDPSLDKNNWSGKILIETKDGQIFEETKILPKGDPKDPMSDEELKDKFKELAETMIDGKSINTLYELINKLENTQMQQIIDILRLAQSTRVAA